MSIGSAALFDCQSIFRGIIYKISFSFPLLRAEALSGYFHSYKRSSDTTTESLVLGVGVGYMLRGRSFVGVTKWSIQITVCVLLFVFGVSIGSDRNLVDNFYNFGWQAAVIACLGVLGSIVAARVAQRLFFKKGGES